MPSTYQLLPNDLFNLIFRLSIALLVGGIIGWEREVKDKPAGLRTHMLVSLGSALFVLIPLLTNSSEVDADPLSRTIQGVAAGVGFLGGGVILRESPRERLQRSEVHGLTSAAAIWVAAALGIAAGCGLWQLALIGALLSLLVLQILKKLEPRV